MTKTERIILNVIGIAVLFIIGFIFHAEILGVAK